MEFDEHSYKLCMKYCSLLKTCKMVAKIVEVVFNEFNVESVLK